MAAAPESSAEESSDEEEAPVQSSLNSQLATLSTNECSAAAQPNPRQVALWQVPADLHVPMLCHQQAPAPKPKPAPLPTPVTPISDVKKKKKRKQVGH